jgi:hypothetical protein
MAPGFFGIEGSAMMRREVFWAVLCPTDLPQRRRGTYSAAGEALLPELRANSKFNNPPRSLSGLELHDFTDYRPTTFI